MRKCFRNKKIHGVNREFRVLFTFFHSANAGNTSRAFIVTGRRTRGSRDFNRSRGYSNRFSLDNFFKLITMERISPGGPLFPHTDLRNPPDHRPPPLNPFYIAWRTTFWALPSPPYCYCSTSPRNCCLLSSSPRPLLTLCGPILIALFSPGPPSR